MLIRSELFPTGHVFLGTEFQFGADAAPFAIVKSGRGAVNVNSRFSILTGHIMAWFEDSTDVESTLDAALKKIMRNLGNINLVSVDSFTLDEDIFEPFGLIVNPVPPFGGFRIDFNIEGVA